MKELIVGDVSVCSEDGDSWDELIKVIRKANKAYLDSLKDVQVQKTSWVTKLKETLFR